MWNFNITLPLHSLPGSTQLYRFAIGRLTDELELFLLWTFVGLQKKQPFQNGKLEKKIRELARRTRMKERPKENKKVLNAKKELTKESVRRRWIKMLLLFLTTKWTKHACWTVTEKELLCCGLPMVRVFPPRKGTSVSLVYVTVNCGWAFRVTVSTFCCCPLQLFRAVGGHALRVSSAWTPASKGALSRR